MVLFDNYFSNKGLVMDFFKNKFYKFKVKISEIEHFENYFPNLKDYKGWVEVSVEPAVKALFCAAFDVKNKKELQDKVLEILKFYKDAPLLKSYFKEEKEKRGFSRFIAFLMIREAVKVIDNKENKLFDKFNSCLKD
jgi:hypothetical protein